MGNKTNRIRPWNVLRDDFWKNAQLSSKDSCWIWEKSKNHDGYGIFYYNNTSCLSHRFSWILSYGEIPDDLRVLHKCDNPPCVNPNHLFLGTQYDNVRDMINKGRMYDRHGAKNSNVKLTEEDVRKIKHLRRGGTTYKNIAKFMRVSVGCISHILNGRHWNWII